MINPNLVFGGGMEYALTFLLVSAIVYAIFSFMRKNDDKFFINARLSGIISVILGLFAAINPTTTRMIQNYLPLFIGLLALFFVVMLSKKMMGDVKTDTSTLVVVLLALIVIIGAVGTNTLERYIGFQAENVVWALGLLVLGALLLKAVKQPDAKTEAS